jgi:hypothetical protein
VAIIKCIRERDASCSALRLLVPCTSDAPVAFGASQPNWLGKHRQVVQSRMSTGILKQSTTGAVSM